jgi:hypothetical protein
MYRTLNPDRIIETLGTLQARITERFPNAGLVGVCAELATIAHTARDRAERIAAPNYGLRALSGLILLVGIGLLFFLLVLVSAMAKETTKELFSIVQGVDAGVNLVIIMGAAALFLGTLEARLKRRRVMRDLHQFRSIIHVIDMHQLTKDPLSLSGQLPPTKHSPKRLMTPGELVRYLDYCSELLSLTTKVAALYAQSFPDPIVTDAVSDLERIASNLSQKIWQKISISDADQRHKQIMAAMAGQVDGQVNSQVDRKIEGQKDLPAAKG